MSRAPETVFYRVTFASVASLDQFGDFVKPLFPNIQIYFSEYKLVRETAKGWWISHSGYDNGKFWVSKTARKRYAYPSKDEALSAFIKRQERRVSILNAHVTKCNIAISIAQELLSK